MAGHGGKVAVVTGGASGIGYAIAERAGTEGMIAGADPDDTTVDPNFRRETGRVPR